MNSESGTNGRIEVIWNPRPEPLTPCGVAVRDEAARVLARRLLTRGPEELSRLQGVHAPGLLVVMGEEQELPWVDGSVYLGREPGANRLLIPTTLACSVSLPLLERALCRQVEAFQLAACPSARVEPDYQSGRGARYRARNPDPLAGGEPLMELPRALMPWAEWLDLFPAELIAPIGELIRRLDMAIGPLHAKGQPGQDEPNGFDGIARRGDYDRLLLSEWLLADEAPDEFLRRATMNEHVFLEPARIAPAGARCSVALFDAGPNQLGAPRLAHLAALIVLARRAQAIGAQFHGACCRRKRETCARK